MSSDPLKNLENIGKLIVVAPSDSEINGLIESGCGQLTDAQNTSLNTESRFSLAYNAAHALARAALRKRGYRCKERYLVFQCLQHTVDLPAAQWRVLDDAHRRRNLAEYEGSLDIEAIEGVLEALIRTVEEIARRL